MATSNGSSVEREFTDKDGEQYFAFANGYSLLSNYHFSPFKLDGVRYYNVEQYIFAKKALQAGDYVAYHNIMAEKRACRYRDITISNVNYDKWNNVRRKIMFSGLAAKFEQNPAAFAKLQSTQPRRILHTTKLDRVQGTGLLIDNDKNFEPKHWEGLNELGYMLMEIRDA